MASDPIITDEYWQTLQINPQDIEYLHTHLFEIETPLTARELASALVAERIRMERANAQARRASDGRMYLPKEKYQTGESLVFPALEWKKGKVTNTRAAVNPEMDAFDVITVEMESGEERMFAASLAKHILNETKLEPQEDDNLDAQSILRACGDGIEKKIEDAFGKDDGLVRIAGRWFPRSLLLDVNAGNLNLAEAALDMTGGEPLPTANLLKDASLPEGVNPKLAEFSLNLALQEDERFDEVGPAGQVLWCLRRLEPEAVRETPIYLQYTNVEHDRSVLDKQMLDLESQLDDELSSRDAALPSHEVNSVTISLIYPHLRAGTLPMSARTKKLFPTAYETPRVRFTLVDGKTGQKIAAWVARDKGYVFGLREWYKAHQLMPGSLVEVKRSKQPGEVIVDAKSQRAAKDWVRTLIVGTDGGMVFAMLKQSITAEFNDRMAIYVSDFKALDPLWEKKLPFHELVISVMREITKLNSQGHAHAQELYAAVNLVRRTPPAPLFVLLATHPIFQHVGDLHFRLKEDSA